ncbi:MAG: 4-hydroxy-3-methylbut-2-enyl diphosphate reductase [Chitinivibrionales bacterium]|nr:4-hydroxy-3-methylbut-2-enyl diphosphate reductase [Chitinivibrionales bacterium]MBD3395744.1 4-hydroxy-3-methylbut-2-enyl diphosphate reductase [Chitinivibrionales bacterium]
MCFSSFDKSVIYPAILIQPMKIRVAQSASFCMGVRRAVDLAVERASRDNARVYTLGPLIHNNQTIEMLRERGVETLGDTDPEPGSAEILVRAHGIPPALQERYASRGHVIVDGTCPKVKTVHKVIEKHRSLGYDIVIAGDEGHAEVIGLMGYAGDAGHLIQSVDAVDVLPAMDKVCLVSQTTFDRVTFDAIAARVRERFAGSDVVVKKTICSATSRRQEETRALAAEVDAMIVVGGRHSANTLRLAKIAREAGTPTQHVETPEEIAWEPLSKCESVGITAGASTPNWMTKRVVEHVQYLAQTRRTTVRTVGWRLLNAAVNLNVFVAGGAVALYYLSCVVQGFAVSRRGAAITFLYFLSMYLYNSLVNVDQIRHLGLNRYQFYRAHRGAVWSLAVVCIACVLWQSFITNRTLLYLMAFLTMAGSFYHFTIVPRAMRGIVKYRTLKDIPTSRDLFVALAWAVLVTAMPHALAGKIALDVTAGLLFLWVFLMAFLRSVIFDLRDIEGDRIMGRETLVIIVGEKRARIAITTALWIALAGLLVFSTFVVAPLYSWRDVRLVAFLLQIPALAYLLFFMRYSSGISPNRTAVFSVLADAQFYIAGLGALLAQSM